MSVKKRGRFYHYEFEFKKKRYQGSTHQKTREGALRVESVRKRQVREDHWGIAAPDRLRTPSLTAWAERVYRHRAKQIRRPDAFRTALRVALQFWGARPRVEPHAAVRRHPKVESPYHNLRLADPILDPGWLLKFEDWMTARGLSGGWKNQLRSAISVLYKTALEPAYRKIARVKENPFAGVRRDRPRSRIRALTLDEIRAILAAAPYHLRVAIAVAMLAPKLRVANILDLRFGREVDDALTKITVTDHKAADHAPPLVTPISPLLRQILTFVRGANTKSDHVVEYQGRAIQSLVGSMRASVTAAGLRYGMTDPAGVTFHTIRHSMATLLATFPELSERMRAEIMGQTIQTAQKYTHLAAVHQIVPHAQLAAAANIGDLLLPGTLTGDERGQAATSQGTRPFLQRMVRSRRRQRKRRTSAS